MAPYYESQVGFDPPEETRSNPRFVIARQPCRRGQEDHAQTDGAAGEDWLQHDQIQYQESQDQRINEKPKIFTAVAADGKEYRFTFQKLEGLKVGAVVGITYTGTLGGPKPVMASNLNLSKSN